MKSWQDILTTMSFSNAAGEEPFRPRQKAHFNKSKIPDSKTKHQI